MLRTFSIFLLLLLTSEGAQANTAWWDVASVRVSEVTDTQPPTVFALEEHCNSYVSPQRLGVDSIQWTAIVLVGEKVWSIVEANKPVVNFNTQVVHALPQGLPCWSTLEHWQAPTVKSYEVKYINGFGMEVVKFRFRLQYTSGGGTGESGLYIANATIVASELTVMWGYTFDAGLSVEQPVNLGTRLNPVVGLELNLNWKVRTVLKESQSSVGFFIQGDGVSTLLN